MTVVGLDDTDSHEGMCTTWVAARLAERLRETGATVSRLLLVRCNPAVPHKTRGNAALAVHTDASPDLAFETARDLVAEHADVDGENTNPAVVVADHSPTAVPERVVEWARDAVVAHHDRAEALDLVSTLAYHHAGWGNARGTIGALAAVGAYAAFEDWTYEYISYRARDRWGTPREIDYDALFTAADDTYPEAWDTVDRPTGAAVCVPRTPCPILHGIRGDDPDAVRRVAERTAGTRGEPGNETGSEPAVSGALFCTNQGTDGHLIDEALHGLEDGYSYRTDGVVATEPETREGGHVHVELRAGDVRFPVVAFEPTKRFRDHVRRLRVGDRLTVCGEVSEGTLKLEKVAVRSLVRTAAVVPRCPRCARTMESAGTGQGYRCRDCKTTASGKRHQLLDRDLEPGWYEVPPTARRHIAKPLVRGGFDAPVHPER